MISNILNLLAFRTFGSNNRFENQKHFCNNNIMQKMSAILLNLQHQVLQQTFRYKKFFLYIERTSLVANKISHQIFCQEHGESLEFFFPLSKKNF